MPSIEPISHFDPFLFRTRAYLVDLLTPVVRVGVTGLARSGKTVFITALIQTLTEGGAVPSFSRLRSINGFRAYLEPQPDDDVPRFAFEDHVAQLFADPPAWPESTRTISQLRLTLEWNESSSRERLRRMDFTQRLHVDIIDYPGEWLIDLSMLNKSYEDWSLDVLNVIQTSGMDALSASFLTFVEDLDPKTPVDEQTAISGATIYTQFLVEARKRSKAGNVLGPGRFLMPGDLEGSPQLTFFPMNGTREMVALLERRFESYKANIVKPFFEKYFARLDRQIVLVDVLSALNGGAVALNELEHGLENVLKAFRPGKNTWLSKLLTRRIDKILFAATKADHVHATSRARLEAILEKCVTRAAERVRDSGGSFQCLAVSALRATQDVEKNKSSETFRCVRGILEAGEVVSGERFDERKSGVIFPGDLPVDPLDAFDQEKAKAAHFHFARFAPPILENKEDLGHPRPWPHINLDKAFSFLLGDYLP